MFSIIHIPFKSRKEDHMSLALSNFIFFIFITGYISSGTCCHAHNLNRFSNPSIKIHIENFFLFLECSLYLPVYFQDPVKTFALYLLYMGFIRVVYRLWSV